MLVASSAPIRRMNASTRVRIAVDRQRSGGLNVDKQLSAVEVADPDEGGQWCGDTIRKRSQVFKSALGVGDPAARVIGRNEPARRAPRRSLDEELDASAVNAHGQHGGIRSSL